MKNNTVENTVVDKSKEKIEVPLDAVYGFLEVRESGKTNMLDANAVLLLMLNETNHSEGALWLLKENDYSVDRKKYSALIKEVEYVLTLPDKLTK